MDSADPLSQLADIHLPEPIGFWPPAPGWWVLLILFAILCVVFYRRHIATWKQKRICSFALRELDKCVAEFRRASSAADSDMDAAKLNFVNEVNAVLRRVALKHYPQDLPASLGGEHWITFLRHHGDASLLDEPLAHTLSQGRFARHWDVDDDALYRMAHQWITSLYLARIASGKDSAGTPTSIAATEHA
ncbi:MAG: DUF4381 domain-containing protein [Gammaproteobacteria bacterium]|nr:DUF4381 domain-containing protein [Gammaproteobacteria bacterium]MDP2139209.1 DUF4381 domain-containing protein [Gammaproteobacteria bacterium]MDP2349022.1 DUF4381 domain-containing protein [Gammaproteobacteria bacterium]